MNFGVYSCLNCSVKSTAVSILNEHELDILETGCLKTEFKKGELILKEGTPAKSIAYVRNGFVKLSKKGIGKKDHILNISTKGAYLGIQNLERKRKENYFSASAITNTEICFIDSDIFGKLLKRNGTFAFEVISYIFKDEMNYFDRLVNNVGQNLPGRLANALLYFNNKVYKTNPFNLNLTQSELASLIGTSRESTSRLLKDFQDSGIINMERSCVTIIDKIKLEEIKLKG